MAELNDDDMHLDHEEDNNQRPPIFRNLGKCPKSFQLGQDFRSYVAKFRMYCNLNAVPEAQRAPLLFTLLDGQAFDLVTCFQ